MDDHDDIESFLSGGEFLDNQPIPFELIALEHILMCMCRNLEQRFESHMNALTPILSQYTELPPSSTNITENSSSHILSESLNAAQLYTPTSIPHSSDQNPLPYPPPLPSPLSPSSSSDLHVRPCSGGSTLMQLLQLKNSLTNFELLLKETGGALRSLLEADEDMLEMYLTLKEQQRSSSSSSSSAAAATPIAATPTSASSTSSPTTLANHSEVELILETYLRKVDELENEVQQNVKSVTLTEEYIQIQLDALVEIHITS